MGVLTMVMVVMNHLGEARHFGRYLENHKDFRPGHKLWAPASTTCV